MMCAAGLPRRIGANHTFACAYPNIVLPERAREQSSNARKYDEQSPE